MGWFDKGLFDGDTPMDIEASYAEALGFTSDISVLDLEEPGEFANWTGKARDAWDWAKMMDKAREFVGAQEIAFQILACWAMAAGVPINDAMKARLAAEIKADKPENWIDTEGRRAEINRLLKALEQYDGSPLLWDSLPLEKTEAQILQRQEFGLMLVNNAWALGDLKVSPDEIAQALGDLEDSEVASLGRRLVKLFADIAEVVIRNREERSGDGVAKSDQEKTERL